MEEVGERGRREADNSPVGWRVPPLLCTIESFSSENEFLFELLLHFGATVPSAKTFSCAFIRELFDLAVLSYS